MRLVENGYIGRGQLDHLLVQPQPLWMALVTEGFAPVTGTGMLLPAAPLLVSSDQPTSPTWYALFVVNLLASIAIVLSFEYAWGSLAFWAPRAAEELNSRTWELLSTLSPLPLDALSGIALGTLLSIVPVGLKAWFPSRTLLGIDQSAAITPAAAAVFVVFATWIFRRGLRHYGRTGPPRLSHRISTAPS